MLVSADDLAAEVGRNLTAVGASGANARSVAAHLVAADVRGVPSHGVAQLPIYIRAIGAGELLPDGAPRVIKDDGATALVSGGWTFGHVAGEFATQLAITKAKQHGVAVVGIVEANHTGRLGTYVETAAAAGLICLVWAGGYGAERPFAAPHGGSRAALASNPLAIGVPTRDEPVVIDFATTEIAGSKVLAARRRGERLPEGAMIDRDGNPTTDPLAFAEGGALLPFGRHKGYALMLAVELIGRAFVGADAYADTERGGHAMRHQGVTIFAARTDLFQSEDAFLGSVATVVDAVHAVPPAPGFDEVLVPGERAARTAQRVQHDGIVVPDDLWAALTSDKFIHLLEAKHA